MGDGVEAPIALDVFGARGAFIHHVLLGEAPLSLSIGGAHARVALVGARFYAASVSADVPLFVDGIQAPTVWTAYELPCTLTIGEAFIHVNREAAENEEPRTEPRSAVLPSTLKDPWAIIGRAPNAAQLRVPNDSNRLGLGWSAPLPPIPKEEEEPIELPVRPVRTGLFFGIALAVAFLGGFLGYVRHGRGNASLPMVNAAQQPPPIDSGSVRAATTPSGSAPAMRAPRRPVRKHHP